MAQSAFIRRRCSRYTRSVVIAVATSTTLLLGGCDNDMGKSSSKLSAQLDQASIEMSGSAADQSKANQTLDSAARETTASLPQRIRAKSMIADSELQTAQATAVQIAANDVQIDRLAREIRLLGNQIQSNNQMAAGLAKFEPTSIQAAVKQKTADITGSDDKPDWYKSDATSLAALSANDKQLTSVQQDISKLQEAIKSETDQRNQLLDQADKFTQQSEHEHTQKSVDLYVQGSNARKQAADISVKLDEDTAALTRAQADLSVRQGQHDSLSSAVKGFGDRSTSVDSDWKTVQDHIAALNASSKKRLGDDPVAAPERDDKGDLITDENIGSKASAIVALAKNNHELRATAEAHFNSAISFYKEAFDLANQLKTDVSAKMTKADSQRPDQLAWTEELSTFEPSTYRFLQADALQQRAEFFAKSAAEAKTRLELAERLKPILAAAQLTPFPTIDDSDTTVASQKTSAAASARASFKDASDLLGKTFDGTGPMAVRSAAQVQDIFTEYAWSQLEASEGDPQQAANHLSSAKDAVSAATADNAQLPPLPTDISPHSASTTDKPTGRSTAH